MFNLGELLAKIYRENYFLTGNIWIDANLYAHNFVWTFNRILKVIIITSEEVIAKFEDTYLSLFRNGILFLLLIV